MLCVKTSPMTVPLAMFFHQSQTSVDFEIFLRFIRDNYGNFFGGAPYPKVIVTDDCSAERSACRAVFPESKLWLCHQHLGKTFDGCHKSIANKETSKAVAQTMKQVMVDPLDISLVDNTIEAVLADPSFQDDDVQLYIRRYANRKVEWMMAYRLNMLVGMQHTTNASESQNSILKRNTLNG